LISYSQNGEDVILNRVLFNVSKGKYVDIGSGHPILDSVTKIFYDNGWTGVNIEPDDRLFPMFETERINDLNLFACVSDKPDDIDYWQATTPGWSTSNKEIATDISKIESTNVGKRKTVSLDRVMEIAGPEINFMKIDCEGDEELILASSLFKSNRPWILVIETVIPRENKSKFASINSILELRNYKNVFFDGLNHYFVDTARPELILSENWYPACALDAYVRNSEHEKIATNKHLNSKILSFTDELARTRLEQEATADELARTRLEQEATADELARTRFEMNILRSKFQAITSSGIWRATRKYRHLKNYLIQVITRLRIAYKYHSSPIKFIKALIRYTLRRVILTFIFVQETKVIEIAGTTDKQFSMLDSENRLIHGSSFRSRLGLDLLSLLPLINKKLYVLVGSTIETESNTGVQKVVHAVVEELIDSQQNPIFVRVDLNLRRIVRLNPEELKKLAKKFEFNYEEILDNAKSENEDYPADATLLVPEVPYSSFSDPLICDVLLAYCNSYNLVPSAIYYDSIPLTTSGYEQSTEAHLSYMRFLSSCAVVSSISKSSQEELQLLFDSKNLAISNARPEFITQHLPMPKKYLSKQSKQIPFLVGTEFVLTVGTVEPRKNQITSIMAFLELEKEIDPLPVLVIAGGVRSDVTHWKELTKDKNIIWLGNVSDEEMIWLYKNCQFTIFISKSEGFGYPVLESAYFGKLCITSAHGSMAEIAFEKPFPLVENVSDISEVKDCIRGLLLRSQALELQNIEFFEKIEISWKSYVATLMNTVSNVLRKKNDSVEILFWIDHTSTFSGNSGIQRVVRGLARSILHSGIGMTPVVWNSNNKNFELASLDQRLHLSNWSGPSEKAWNLDFDLGSNSGKTRILIIPELTTYSFDEHFLLQVLSKAKNHAMSTVVIFHDALPALMPEVYPPEAAQKHRAYMNDLSSADAILTTSQSGRNDLTDYFLSTKELNPSSISKIWTSPLPSLFIGESSRAFHSISQLDTKRNKTLVLSVGTLEARKNYIKMIQAFERALNALPDDTIELVIIGKGVDAKIIEFVEDACNRLPITWLGHVSDEVVKQYYRTCDFTVFPSLGEGFGLPLTESLGFGKPVICGTGGALRENALLGGCLMVNVNDTDDLALGIAQLASDAKLFQKLSEEIKVRKFVTWDEYATNVLKISLSRDKRAQS